MCVSSGSSIETTSCRIELLFAWQYAPRWSEKKIEIDDVRRYWNFSHPQEEKRVDPYKGLFHIIVD